MKERLMESNKRDGEDNWTRLEETGIRAEKQKSFVCKEIKEKHLKKSSSLFGFKVNRQTTQTTSSSN